MWIKINSQPNLLCHSGVKGMKWGVVHEEKLSVPNKHAKQKEPEIEKKGLTDKQKKVLIIGASAVAAGLIIYGGYKLQKSGKLGTLSDIGKTRFKDSSFDDTTGFRKIQNTDILRKKIDIRSINPGKKNLLDRGSQNNCGNCTIANELQKRGLDVCARKNPDGMRLETFGEFFKGLREDSITVLKPDDGLSEVCNTSPSKLIERGQTISSRIGNHISQTFPEGSRGNMFIPFDNGNHFTSWEIKGGQAIFKDPQHPETNIAAMFSQINTNTTAAKSYGGVRIHRLDDLEINTDSIRKVVKSRLFDMKDKVSEVYNVADINGGGFVMKNVS